MDNNNPLISIIMATHQPNIDYLKQSITSILSQTYKNFEFIIIIDGYDSSLDDIVSLFTDPRILFIKNIEHQGLTKCLNQGLRVSKGDYIARMDDDDISIEERLKKQVEYFQSHHEVNVLGSNTEIFGDHSYTTYYQLKETRTKQQVALLFQNHGVAHPTVMFRKSFLRKYGIEYDERYPKSQDYAMWVRCTKYTMIHCLPEVLLKYRRHKKQISSISVDVQTKFSDSIKINQVNQLIGSIDPRFEEIYLEFCNEKISNLDDIVILNKLVKRIKDANKVKCIYDQRILIEELNKRMFVIYLDGFSKTKSLFFLSLLVRNLKASYLLSLAKQFVHSLSGK